MKERMCAGSLASMALLLAAFPASADTPSKEKVVYDRMLSCFAEKSKAVDDLTTPLADMADVLVGLCWEQVNDYRVRWMNGWGSDWSSFIGPYFTLQINAKAKEAVFTHRMSKRQRSGG